MEKTENVHKDISELRDLNRWLIALSAIVIIWAAGIIMYMDKRTSPSNHPLPIIMIDADTGKIIDPAYTNLFPDNVIGTMPKNVNMSEIKDSDNATKPLFEKKDSYNIKDFVIINYFYVEGLIIDKSGDNYTVLYKDHNHVLQKIIISKEFLLVPTSKNSVSPVSLLVD